MKRAGASLVIGFCLTLPALGSAATLLETVHEGGGMDRMYIDGERMRIDADDDPSYLLIDAGTGRLYAVDPVERRIIDMSAVAQRGVERAGERRDFTVQVENLGEGPAIAGYATSHYLISVNGRACSEEFLSKQAVEDIGGVEAFKKIVGLLSGLDAGMGRDEPDECAKADALTFQEYVGYGFPLKVLAPDGSVDALVVKVVKDTALPPHGFELPEGYRVTDMQNLLPDMP